MNVSFTDKINHFSDYLIIEKKYSSLSAKAYSKDLLQFSNFLDKQFEISDCNEVQLIHIRSFVSLLKQQGLAHTSILRKASTIKSFFKYLQQKKVITQNPTLGIVLPKKKRKLPEYIDNSINNKIHFLQDISKDFQTETEKLIFLLFYNTGIRRAELIGLRVEDIDIAQKKIRVEGKGKKIRWIPLSDSLTHRIALYITGREKRFKIATNTFLFVSDKGLPYYDKKVYRVIKKILNIITTMSKKSPHILRHTFATQLLNNGAGINDIKELLGHANLSATQIYTHATIDNLKKSYKKFHPKA